MIEYGYMDGGYLRSKILEPIVDRYKDEKGVIQEETISVEDQIYELVENGYKPVDPIDEEKMIASKEHYTIRLKPYNNGDRISYMYIEVPDLKEVRQIISSLKDQLDSSDYKIIKCYEASLRSIDPPYDINEISDNRQSIRDKINEYEQLLNELQK